MSETITPSQKASQEVIEKINESNVEWDKIDNADDLVKVKHNILSSIKERYLREVKMVDDKCKRREYVEMRAALMNALRYICTENEVATVLWGRHRTSAYHAFRNHDMYFTSPLYRILFSVAVRVVGEYESTLRAYPMRGKYETNYNVRLMLQDIRILQVELKKKLDEFKAFVGTEAIVETDPWYIQQLPNGENRERTKFTPQN